MEQLIQGIYAIIIAFVIGVILCPILIPILHKMKYGQTEREDGPESHLKKQGTPTIGGLIFIVATIIVTILYSIIYVGTFSNEVIIALGIFLSFLIGRYISRRMLKPVEEIQQTAERISIED